MSFEDDEYWDEEYSEYSIVPNAAVVQERQHERRDVPDSVIPTRRGGDPDAPADELAARRRRRSQGNSAGDQPRRPQVAFDTQRPSWLDDPDFVPIDTSQPNLAGDDFGSVDFNRPELGADFDAPDTTYADTTYADTSSRRPDDRYDPQDDIDEPFDHRDLVAYGHGPNPGVQTVSRSDDEERPAGRWRQRPEQDGVDAQRVHPDDRRAAPRRSTEERPRPEEVRPAPPTASGRARVPEARPDESHDLYRRRPEDERGRPPRRPAARRDDAYEYDDRHRPYPEEGVRRSGERTAMIWDEPAPAQRGEGRPLDGTDERDRRRTARRPDEYDDRRDYREVDDRRGLPPRRRDDRRTDDLRPRVTYDELGPVPTEADERGRRPGERDDRRTWAAETDDRRSPRTIEGEILDDRAPRTIEGEIVDDRRRPRVTRSDDRRSAPAARESWDDRRQGREPWADDRRPAGEPWAERQSASAAHLERDDYRRSTPADGPTWDDQKGRKSGRSRNNGTPVGGQGWTDEGTDAADQGWTKGGSQRWAGDGTAGRETPPAAKPQRPPAGPSPAAAEPAAAAAATAGSAGQVTPGTDETDGARVAGQAAPPAAPRVVSKEEPPPLPRVVKKSESPATPRVVGTHAPTPAARVISPPAAPVTPAAQPPAVPIRPAASSQAPVAPARAAEQVGPGPQPPVAPARAAEQVGPGPQPSVPATPRGPVPGTQADGGHPQSPGSDAREQDGTPDLTQSPTPGGPSQPAANRPAPPGTVPPLAPDGRGPGQEAPLSPVPPQVASGQAVRGPVAPQRPLDRSLSDTDPRLELPPGQRSRRSPRSAHVFLAEGDDPWAMVPDEAPPAATPSSGLSRPVSPGAPWPADAYPPSPGSTEHDGGHRGGIPHGSTPPASVPPEAAHGPATPQVPPPGVAPRPTIPMPPAAAPRPASAGGGSSRVDVPHAPAPRVPSPPPVVPHAAPTAPAPPLGAVHGLTPPKPSRSVPPTSEQGRIPGDRIAADGAPADASSTGRRPTDPAPRPEFVGEDDGRPAPGPSPARPAPTQHPQAPGQAGQPGPGSPDGQPAAPHKTGGAFRRAVDKLFGGSSGHAPEQEESPWASPPGVTAAGRPTSLASAPVSAPNGGRTPVAPQSPAERRTAAPPAQPLSDVPTQPMVSPRTAGMRSDSEHAAPSADRPQPGARWGQSPDAAPPAGGGRPVAPQPPASPVERAGPPQITLPLRPRSAPPANTDAAAQEVEQRPSGVPAPRQSAGSPTLAPAPTADGPQRVPTSPAAPGRSGSRAGTEAPVATERNVASEAPAAPAQAVQQHAVQQQPAPGEARAANDPTTATPPQNATAADATESATAARRSRHAGLHDGAKPTDAAPEDPTRLGAHAVPYMDPDGVLHNLRPIGRLVVSGPDAPLRNAETAFGGQWFTAKPETATEDGPGPGTVEPAEPERVDQQRMATAGGVPQTGGPADSAARGETATGDAPRVGAVTSVDAGTELVADRADRGASSDGVAGPGGAPPEGLVIDLDITGLFRSMAITGERPALRDERPAARDERPAPCAPTVAQPPVDAASVRARIDERMAFDRAAAERDAPVSEPEKARPALSAADLEAIRWRLDGGTLREVVDDRDALRELGERLDGPLADEVDNIAKAGLLSVRAEVYRLLGELGMAAAASRLALAHAESARDPRSEVIAQAELAHILRLRGDFKEADRLFAKATGSGVPETLRSVVHENAGRSCYDQGRHMEALDHFARAVRLGRTDDAELAARVGVCLEAVYIHVLRDGWGPYPRTREDILGISKPARTVRAPAESAPARNGGTPGNQPAANGSTPATNGRSAFAALDEVTAEQPIIRRR